MVSKTTQKTYDEKAATFYVEQVCCEADLVYRFSYVVSLSKDEAFASVVKAFKKAVESLPSLLEMPSVGIRAMLLQSCWQSAGKGGDKSEKAGSPLQKMMSAHSRETRAAFFAVDIAGLSLQEAASVLAVSEDQVRASLVKARASLVHEEGFAKKDFFFTHLPEFLNEQLDADKTKAFEKLMAEEKGADEIPERYKQALGHLQLLLQGYYLAELQITQLQELVEPKEVRETMEAQKIEEVDQWEATGNMRRRVAITLVVLGCIFSLVYYFSPKREVPFNALQNLVYEALAMEEDATGRLNLPSNEINDIVEYFKQHPSLEFTPVALVAFGPEWRPDGASVIDYETGKVSVVQYYHPAMREHLFVFSYRGKLSDLPKAPQGNVGGLVYQTYTSEQLNVVAWQSGSGTVSMVVGRRSAPELAGFAQKGTVAP